MKKNIIILIIIVIITAVSTVAILKPKDFTVVENENIYNDVSGRFSFTLPVSFGSFPEQVDNGELILFSIPGTSDVFQLYITPFDEKADVLTVDRLKTDIPDIKISEPQSIVVDGVGRGLSFVSEEDGRNKREIWFVYGGYLYQVTISIESAEIVYRVLDSWDFGELGE